ncbi:hypothetical protein Tco_1122250 [Tanacetum coccineum]|uniref:Uncharacterized protein n=1 Tax=Tanacetum coccineum TaxID=301880 RepID=A0ABQ5J030_9ASTR
MATLSPPDAEYVAVLNVCGQCSSPQALLRALRKALQLYWPPLIGLPILSLNIVRSNINSDEGGCEDLPIVTIILSMDNLETPMEGKITNQVAVDYQFWSHQLAIALILFDEGEGGYNCVHLCAESEYSDFKTFSTQAVLQGVCVGKCWLRRWELLVVSDVLLGAIMVLLLIFQTREETDELERSEMRDESKKQDVLNSAKIYTDSDWN